MFTYNLRRASNLNIDYIYNLEKRSSRGRVNCINILDGSRRDLGIFRQYRVDNSNAHYSRLLTKVLKAEKGDFLFSRRCSFLGGLTSFVSLDMRYRKYLRSRAFCRQEG